MSKEPTIHKTPELEEKSFWDKVARAVGVAGREVLEIALTLYYVLEDEDTPNWARATIIGALIYSLVRLTQFRTRSPVLATQTTWR